jgi:hypothetical protein
LAPAKATNAKLIYKDMRKKIVVLLLVFSFALVACSGSSNREAVNLQTARDALESFFSLLSYGAYEQAAYLYGGSYEELRSLNPTVAPDDYISLWENACTVNGFQCLEIKQVLKEYQDDNGVFHFLVQFKQRNSDLLEVGPCCGTDATRMPLLSQFEYQVIRRQGKFLVQDLPILEP